MASMTMTMMMMLCMPVPTAKKPEPTPQKGNMTAYVVSMLRYDIPPSSPSLPLLFSSSTLFFVFHLLRSSILPPVKTDRTTSNWTDRRDNQPTLSRIQTFRPKDHPPTQPLQQPTQTNRPDQAKPNVYKRTCPRVDDTAPPPPLPPPMSCFFLLPTAPSILLLPTYVACFDNRPVRRFRQRET
ncbi:hypothetical protein VTJ04DRAFT_3809 [Mycothermus thermophilus]|uniref:uncharacterized protein n=1 Tax=Humicola insolens TaxID=85995 RepID=UPI00374257B1